MPPSVNNYNQNDFLRIQSFLKKNSNTPGKINGDIFKMNDRHLNLDEPWTMDNIAKGDYTGGLTIIFDHKAPRNKRLQEVKLSNSHFSGDLDLTGCDNLRRLILTGSNINSVKIPKNSFVGRTMWFAENATEQQLTRMLNTVAKDKDGKLSLDEMDQYFKNNTAGIPVIPAGDQTLTHIANNTNAFNLAVGENHPFFKENKTKYTSVILVN